jgi:hypothetical protein
MNTSLGRGVGWQPQGDNSQPEAKEKELPITSNTYRFIPRVRLDVESNEQSIINAYNSNVQSGFPTGPGGVEELEAAQGLVTEHWTPPPKRLLLVRPPLSQHSEESNLIPFHFECLSKHYTP